MLSMEALAGLCPTLLARAKIVSYCGPPAPPSGPGVFFKSRPAARARRLIVQHVKSGRPIGDPSRLMMMWAGSPMMVWRLLRWKLPMPRREQRRPK
ncbi:hypothetical protein CHELA1G11_10024 [Hyphomicrobiales bacterium]|nr:hypothetical protein CHELA1G11_10024 [Hyphomicrobiales bacterium]CAH1677608.1 hypothetical protein CHELA1G2_14286 [Hyphomicrobiales bacterium]